ncbi:hypothetical protein [Arthrobacter sp. ok909]|nr:hypothetical protein [Arthrobacter sp. ok909]
MAAKRKALAHLGAPKDIINRDHGVTGRNTNGRD